MSVTGRVRRDPARQSARARVSRVSRFLGEVDEHLGTDLAAQSEVVARIEAAVDPDASALGLLRIVEAAVSADSRELLDVLPIRSTGPHCCPACSRSPGHRRH